MSFRIIGMVTLAVLSSFWFMPSASAIGVQPVSSEDANKNPALPQNFRVSEFKEGPGRFQVTLVYEWDRAKKPGTTESYTDYQLNAHCAFKALDSKVTVGGNSAGTQKVSGPGPTYRVLAVCSCGSPGRNMIQPRIRVNQQGLWVYPAKAPDPVKTHASIPGTFYPPCKRV